MKFDIDRFKKVNNTNGHLVSDEVVQTIASIIEGLTLSTDCVPARFAGEEIAILMTMYGPVAVCVLAEKGRPAIEVLSCAEYTDQSNHSYAINSK